MSPSISHPIRYDEDGNRLPPPLDEAAVEEGVVTTEMVEENAVTSADIVNANQPAEPEKGDDTGESGEAGDSPGDGTTTAEPTKPPEVTKSSSKADLVAAAEASGIDTDGKTREDLIEALGL